MIVDLAIFQVSLLWPDAADSIVVQLHAPQGYSKNELSIQPYCKQISASRHVDLDIESS